MTTSEPLCLSGPHPPGQDLAGDERGAIMVMGIFMCVVMVGALWYLAGIGDALVFRERLQEASDAAAFSTAVTEARGMNLIVMINLIMACILGIRVALKIAILALTIVSVIMFGLAAAATASLIGAAAAPLFTAAGIACEEGATAVQEVLNVADPLIDAALEGLSAAELGIKYAIPPAGIAVGTAIGMKYKPPVLAVTGTPDPLKLASGLPVVEGSADKLCAKAGESLGALLGLLPIPGMSGKSGGPLRSIMSSIAKGGAAYFCEMGSGGPPPDLGDTVDDTSDTYCDNQRKKLQNEADRANDDWTNACSTFPGVSCWVDPIDRSQSSMTGTETLKPAEVSKLQGLQGTRDTKQSSADNFDKDGCKKDKKKEMNKKLNDQIAKQNSGSSSGDGKTPKKVDPDWFNGMKDYQVIGVVFTASMKQLNLSPKLVRIGAFGNEKAGKMDVPPAVTGTSFAQAEFFYDCAGGWTGKECNGSDGEDAMWHFHWKARLRRYDAPFSIVEVAVDAAKLGWGLDALSKAVERKGPLLNYPQRLRLTQAAVDNMVVH